jgi:hypothetical protein
MEWQVEPWVNIKHTPVFSQFYPLKARNIHKSGETQVRRTSREAEQRTFSGQEFSRSGATRALYKAAF